jgi:hypothetical protein
MNAVTAPEPVSAGTLEQVIGTGNLKALSSKQRVEYMLAVCRSRGLNPLTRPFRFMEFQGQVVLYATRDCADQLRKLDGISTEIVSKEIDGDLYVVEAQATDKTGRKDSDVGAVVIGTLRGEARANAIMKACTKAKRRVTLSICGLGILDETEVGDMRGAVLIDDPVIDAEPQDERMARLAPTYDERKPVAKAPPAKTDEKWQDYLSKLRLACATTTSRAEVEAIGSRPSVADAAENGPEWVQDEVRDILTDAYAKWDVTGDGWPGPDPEKATA